VHDRPVELSLGLTLKVAWVQCDLWSGLSCAILSPAVLLLNIWVLAFWLDWGWSALKHSLGWYWLHRGWRRALATCEQGPVCDPWYAGVWALGC